MIFRTYIQSSPYDFNTADKLNTLLINALVSTGELKEIAEKCLPQTVPRLRRLPAFIDDSYRSPSAGSAATAVVPDPNEPGTSTELLAVYPGQFF